MQAFMMKENRTVEVVMTDTYLTCHTVSKDNKQQNTVNIPLTMVMAVETDQGPDSTQMIIHYTRKTDNYKFKVDTLSLTCTPDRCELFVSALRKVIDESQRPRHLLVIINPNSGRRRAVKIYHRRVKPLFQLCGITDQVIVTRKPKEAKEMLQVLDLSKVDGVITVGGDGLYSECLSGLVMRAQRDAGIDYNSPDAEQIPSRIPIGVIPAGSGNYVAQYLHNTSDIMTAAIHIVLGKTVSANAVSVHQGGQLSAYSGLLLGFGLFGEIMNDCEKFRWMGPSRYNVIPVGTVLRRRTFDVEIDYQMHDTKEWRKTAGMMYGVDTYVITRKDRGDIMAPSFGDDALTLFMTSKCSFVKHVQHLAKVQDHKTGCFDYEFVQQARVQRYKVSLPRSVTMTTDSGDVHLQEKYYINCDGEVLQVYQPEFEVRLHKHAISLFGEITQ